MKDQIQGLIMNIQDTNILQKDIKLEAIKKLNQIINTKNEK